MTASNTMAKRAAAGTLALAVCLTGGLVSAGAANAAAGFTFTRISGETRIETAVAASQAAFPTGSPAAGGIVLVNKDRTVDGLTASYAAGVENAPILYTDLETVPAATLAEMTRLGTRNVTIVGGTAVVAASVETSLEAAGYTVERVGGEDRYDTAAQVSALGGTTPTKVFVASGERFADALAVGPIAYAQNYPILLTRTNDVPASTTIALETLQETSVLVVGGTTVVPDANYSSVGGTQRLFGADRQGTAAAVAQYAIANEGFVSTDVAIAGNLDTNAADALAAAPFAGKNGIPLLFAEAAGSTATNTYLASVSPLLTGRGYVLGGVNAVSEAAVATATAAATGTVTVGNQSLLVTPSEAATLGFDEVRQYAVPGLDADEEYRITLVDADNISVSENGVVSFEEDGVSGLADRGTVQSTVTVVNGVTVTSAGPAVGPFAPVNGALSFTVTSDDDQVEDFVPVVYVDGGSNARLELDDEGLPTEVFGLGGAIQVVPDEAATGDVVADENVAVVDKTGDVFITDDSLYNYDAGDNYFIGGTASVNAVTPAEFEAQLSVGDILTDDTIYQRNADLDSTFVLSDIDPAPLAALTEVSGETTDTSVLLTLPSLDDDATEVNVYAEVQSVATGAIDAVVTDESDIVATASADADADEDIAGTQILVSGLTAGTLYDFNATQTVDGEESAINSAVELNDVDTRAQAVERATLDDTDLTTDAPIEGVVSTGDVWTLTFSEPVTIATGAGASYLDVTDNNGDTFRVVNAAAAADDFLTGATFVYLNDAGAVSTPATDTIRVTFLEDAEDRNSAGDVTATTGTVGYDATITGATNLLDVDDAAAVDIAGSTDVLVNDES